MNEWSNCKWHYILKRINPHEVKETGIYTHDFHHTILEVPFTCPHMLWNIPGYPTFTGVWSVQIGHYYRITFFMRDRRPPGPSIPPCLHVPLCASLHESASPSIEGSPSTPSGSRRTTSNANTEGYEELGSTL